MASRTRTTEASLADALASAPASLDEAPPDVPTAPHAETEDPFSPTLPDVLGVVVAYLLTQYPDSVPDQEAVLDAARMADDGLIVLAWARLSRMMGEVLNVPVGA